jgi:hypothetical protein
MPAEDPVSIARVYSWWWLHDARWYQGVASRFGFDVANEVNQEALRYMAQRVARLVAKECDVLPRRMSFPDAVDVFCRCCSLMWPKELLQFECNLTGPDTFEIDIVRNFALDMLRRAGTLERYVCPCLALREGWFQGLDLHPIENRVTQCVLNGAERCTIFAKLQTNTSADTTDQSEEKRIHE